MSLMDNARAAVAANEYRKMQAQAAQLALPDLLSGEATWVALKKGIEDMKLLAPQDHDVFMQVDDVRVLQGRFIYPHSFFLEGLDHDGNHTRLILHFSQLKARVINLPKRGPDRVISILAGAV